MPNLTEHDVVAILETSYIYAPNKAAGIMIAL